MEHIVVVGGSIAGFTAAAELRHQGFDGRLTVVADEPTKTYERPPLSKRILAGDDPETVAWNAAEDDSLDLDWALGARATALDVEHRTLTLADGRTIDWDGMVIATGATPRRLPDQPDLAGVHVVRSLDDSLALRADLDAGAERVVVVGAGFIGAEVAATCRGRGHEVTLVEPLPQPLARVLGEEMGRVIADRHRAEGVDVRLGVGVEAIVDTDGDGRVDEVRLGDGTTVEADVVVVGIGVVPNTAWLEDSGLALDDGVVTDDTCLVAPGIVAAGDVARWDSARYDASLRVEHWDHAVEMGRAAAKRLLATDDEAEAFDPVPWFWSDQYDARIQVAGRITPPDAGGTMAIVDGAIEDDKFVALYGADGRVTAALGWNWPAKTVRYRMALESGLSWDEAVG